MSSTGRSAKTPARAPRAAASRHAVGRSTPPVLQDPAGALSTAERALRALVKRPDTLFEVVRAVGATTEPAEIGRVAIEHAASWIPAASWAVVAADPTGQPTVLAAHSLDSDLVHAVRAAGGWVMDMGRPFLTANVGRDGRVESRLAATVAAFPLSCRGHQIGAIVALDAAPSAEAPRLGAPALTALAMLLEPIASALDKALLLKRAQALSVTDDLTGLHNSRYLNQALRWETKRASRSGRPLSLLFIDLDGFKSINDSFGHSAGSRALVEAGALMRASARETDIVARFGGDEFALVLPDTGEAGALAVAERIRARIARHAFLSGENRGIHLTASIGIATLPDAASSADELVQAADSAMYEVKNRGKNGIQTARPPADK